MGFLVKNIDTKSLLDINNKLPITINNNINVYSNIVYCSPFFKIILDTAMFLTNCNFVNNNLDKLKY